MKECSLFIASGIVLNRTVVNVITESWCKNYISIASLLQHYQRETLIQANFKKSCWKYFECTVSSNYLLSLWLQQQIFLIGMNFIRIKELRGMKKLTACIRIGLEQFKEWWSRWDQLWSSWGSVIWVLIVWEYVPSLLCTFLWYSSTFTSLNWVLKHNLCNSEFSTYKIFANDLGVHVVL